jgi:uncharacterized protein YbjT (DUF2867 family)
MEAPARTADSVHRVVFTGATRNFFKVGHTSIHHLSRHHPEVAIRLALPDVDIARDACAGADVEFVQWDPARPESLVAVYSDCQSTLLVAPIQGRVAVGRVQVGAMMEAGVQFVCCLGIQYDDGLVMSREVAALDEVLAASGIRHCTLRLPMFLENLLYQAVTIHAEGRFSFPCRPDSPVAYVTCGDLGQLCGDLLASGGRMHLPGLRLTAGLTSCGEIARLLSETLGREVRFVPITGDEHVAALADHGSLGEHAARAVLELWEAIDRGEDMQPNADLARALGRAPESVGEWIAAHACCFSRDPACPHPQPPLHPATFGVARASG